MRKTALSLLFTTVLLMAQPPAAKPPTPTPPAPTPAPVVTKLTDKEAVLIKTIRAQQADLDAKAIELSKQYTAFKAQYDLLEVDAKNTIELLKNNHQLPAEAVFNGQAFQFEQPAPAPAKK